MSDDTPEQLRRRLEGLRARQAELEARERQKVLYIRVGAGSWYVQSAGRRAAEWAIVEAARALGLGVVPSLAWFRPGGPHDWPTDPGAFRGAPHLQGYVDPAEPLVVGLNAALSNYPQGGVSPSLQEVVAHEAQHVADLLARPTWRDRHLEELRASATAWALVHGEPAPFGAPPSTLSTPERRDGRDR